MKRAKISDLNARLSAYLGEVRRGRTIVVCDRTVRTNLRGTMGRDPLAQLVAQLTIAGIVLTMPV